MWNKIQKIYVGDHYQVYPKWTPWANTIAYYPLEKDWNDYSWNWHNGTASWITYSSISWVNCASFAWSISSYIAIPWLWTLSTLTTSIWFNTTTTKSGSQLFWASPSSDNANLQEYVDWSAIRISRWNGSNSDPVSYSVACNNGVWHNLIVTNGSDWLKMYYDGTLVWSSNNVRTIKSDNWRTYLWWWNQLSTYTYLWYMSSLILENKIWTAQEIADYYNQTKATYLWFN